MIDERYGAILLQAYRKRLSWAVNHLHCIVYIKNNMSEVGGNMKFISSAISIVELCSTRETIQGRL